MIVWKQRAALARLAPVRHHRRRAPFSTRAGYAAVRSLTNGWTYTYDLNGNMITRTEMITLGQFMTYTQAWDVENRLIAVTATQGGAISVTQFVYDGDGQRVLQIKPNGDQTAYVGNLLEVEFNRPAAPSNLTTTQVLATQINLAWVDNSNNETGFIIERSPNGVNWSSIVTTTANITAYNDTGLTCNQHYYYRVRATNAAGDSANTHVDVYTAACGTPPAAPSNLNAAVSYPRINLSWTDNSNNETQFYLERTAGSGWAVIASLGSNVTFYTDFPCGSILPPNGSAQSAINSPAPPGSTTFSYRVRAYNAYGYSGYSNTKSATITCLFSGGTTTGASGMLVMTLSDPPAGQVWKSYYFAGSQLIAERVQGDPVAQNNGVFFLHADHLGSTSLATDANGAVVPNSRQLYDAWGNVRTKGTGLPTDVSFTGKHIDGTGLVYLGARYYAPSLNRWLSPDTIVPQPGNPQDLNRYSYTRNNPVKYTDPTGHCSQDRDRDSECWEQHDKLVTTLGSAYANDGSLAGWSLAQLTNLLTWIDKGMKFTGNGWTGGNLQDVSKGLDMVKQALGDKVWAALGLIGGRSLFINRLDCPGCGAGGRTYGQSNLINLWLPRSSAVRTVETTVHEIGHIIDWHAGNNLDFSLSPSEPWLAAGNYVNIADGWFSTDTYSPNRLFPSQYAAAAHDPREDFADTFAWSVYTQNGSVYGPTSNYNQVGPNLERQNALSVALDKFK